MMTCTTHLPAVTARLAFSALLGLCLIGTPACSGPSTEVEPSGVTVTVMVAAKNPELTWPTDTGDGGAPYASGCSWVTRRSDAVVCFDVVEAGQGRTISMVVHGIRGAPSHTFKLFAPRSATQADPAMLPPAGASQSYVKHPEYTQAQRWLKSHRIKKARTIGEPALELAADKRVATVTIDDKRWMARLPPTHARSAPTDWQRAHIDACCAPTLVAVIAPAEGAPVALFGRHCRVKAQDHACARDAAAPCPAVPADRCLTYPKWRGNAAADQAPTLYHLMPAPPKPAPVTAASAAKTAELAALLAGPSAVVKRAPERFTVAFHTTKGDFQVLVTRAWAPHGADRFYGLVKAGFYRDIAIFRVISGFMSQFGVHGSPAVAGAWRSASIPDDPVNPAVASNQRGYLTFAKAGPNTRSTQLFISFRDNSNLDRMGFPPIGRVIGAGMSVVDQIYAGYGEGAPRGRGPDQGRVQHEGNTYLRRDFPELDYITDITLLP